MVYFPYSLWQFAISADYFVKTFELRALTVISSAFDGLWVRGVSFGNEIPGLFQARVNREAVFTQLWRKIVNANKYQLGGFSFR